jgi:anthranilate phosphoribosyltransferase
MNGARSANRDIVVLNSAACFYLAGHADSIAAGVRLANDVLDSGKAMDKLEQLIAATNFN